jgi:hypothetical protein
MNVHVTVTHGDVTFAALGFRFEICDSAFGGRKAISLCGADPWRRSGKRDEQRSQE